jgi:hypothetical protein
MRALSTRLNFTLQFSTLARYLIPASLCYLAFPYIIFFVGWLKWYFALLCIGLVAFPLLRSVQELDWIVGKEPAQPDEAVLRPRHIILLLLAALLLLSISGVGGYGYQDTDWLKHNSVLKDLIERPWPVVYKLEGQDVPLVYYVAFYLPAAFAGKLGGWALANHGLFIWTLIGLILAILWFLVLNRRAASTVILLFVIFSGLDAVGEAVVTPIVAALRPEVSAFLNWAHIEQWAIGWQYSANTTLLFWVPNQALVGWIATGMLVYAILHSPQKRCSFFYCGLTALWSPFVTLGFLPYFLAEFILENGNLPKRLKQYLSLPNLCGIVLLAVIGLFYSAKFYHISSLLTGDIPHGFSLSFLDDMEAKVIGLALIGIFCLLEFGIYAMFIYSSNWDSKTKVLFATTLLCLFFFPFYRYGRANDFVMRTSIPSLFVLAVLLGRTLHGKSLIGLKRIVLVTLVALGSVTALVEFRRHATKVYETGRILQMPEIDQVTSLWNPSIDMSDSLILQYVGSSQAPFFRWMAKQ